MKKILVAGLMVTLMSGCASMQNEDGSTKKTGTYGGSAALAGALAGALIGHDNRGKGALIGAAVAGAAGAGYGYYVDKQEAELRKQMEGTGVGIERNGDELNIVMPGSITFETGRSDIQSSFYPTLNELAKSVRQYEDSNLVITGHTDSTGTYQRNQSLSMQRADAVAAYLRSTGIDTIRLQTVGASSSMPVASNSTDHGRAQNRRVEVKLIPKPAAHASAN